MFIVGTHIEDIGNLKSKLNASFDMKDLRNTNHILGMYIVQNREKKVLFLSQSHIGYAHCTKWREESAFHISIRLHFQGAYSFQYGGREGIEYFFTFICEIESIDCPICKKG